MEIDVQFSYLPPDVSQALDARESGEDKEGRGKSAQDLIPYLHFLMIRDHDVEGLSRQLLRRALNI